MARKQAREVGKEAGLRQPAIEALATAVSELARNILVHAGSGEVTIGVGLVDDRSAVVTVARDLGPGIHDLARAMEDGYSTGPGLGLGLPGARRLVDHFDIVSKPGHGTTVTLAMWTR